MESKKPNNNDKTTSESGVAWVKSPKKLLQLQKKPATSPTKTAEQSIGKKDEGSLPESKKNEKPSSTNTFNDTSEIANVSENIPTKAGTSKRSKKRKSKAKISQEIQQPVSTTKSNDNLEDKSTTVTELEEKNVTSIASSSKTHDTCFDLCEKLISKVKSGNEETVELFGNILNFFNNNNDDLENRNLKLNLLETLLDNLVKADANELKRIKELFKAIFLPVSLARLVIDVDDITLSFFPIGRGNKSTIFVGSYEKNNRNRRVAVKACHKEGASIRDEALILSQLNHRNVIKILGIDQDTTKMVLEYMDRHCVLLALYQDDIDSSNKNLFKMLVDVSIGMEYIHSQKILHRDLALRNVFCNSKSECKIGDFELAVYVGDSNGEYIDPVDLEKSQKSYVPRDNMSPESVDTGKYTFKSDVWSMGILCWDMFRAASTKEIPNSVEKALVIHGVRSGLLRLERPTRCPKGLFSYVTHVLLHKNPAERPTFPEVKTVIQNMKF